MSNDFSVATEKTCLSLENTRATPLGGLKAAVQKVVYGACIERAVLGLSTSRAVPR